MSIHARQAESHLYQLRLLLEELCCDLCRFEHVVRNDCHPENVQIDREFPLGAPGIFADIRVAPEGQQPYFVEVKYGYSNDMLQRRLQQKYGPGTPGSASGSKVVLVLDVDNRSSWTSLAAELARCLRPGLELEIWDEQRLFALTRERFRTDFEAITTENLLNVREAIDRAKGFYAFQGRSFEEYEHDPLKADLLWHFGFWRLRQLRERGRLTPRDTLPPGAYRGVAVLLADLCSFSSYVRDTSDSEIIREGLTSFYSKARYQIINNGGMLYQFVGDQVVGFFGIPETNPGYVSKAFATAPGLAVHRTIGLESLAAPHRPGADLLRSAHRHGRGRHAGCFFAALRSFAYGGHRRLHQRRGPTHVCGERKRDRRE